MEPLAVYAMVALVVLALARPLRAGVAATATSALPALEAARDAKLREIHDAEDDVQAGKLSEHEHAEVAARLRAEAVELLRRLDAERERTP